MRRGQQGSWLYFLIKGKLVVYRDEPDPAEALNAITPGELFGDLALLSDRERKATVAAPADRGALLFACDFQVFGELDDFSRVTLPTKLLFYRTVVHSIRWRLEVGRMEQPQHPLVSELLRIPVYARSRDTLEELQALDYQAQRLALLLERWNQDNSDLFMTGGEPQA
jgi:CRP-like cAMP-binding protein